MGNFYTNVRAICVSCAVLILSLIAACDGYSLDRSAAFEMNKRLGRGVNIGNTFEASPKEDSWGNPWKPEYLKTISDLGFKHIRLPINWETDERAMLEAPYTIKPEFMTRIKGVVDEALKNKLLVIVNMHHHWRVHKDPDASRDRFLSQWAQIAEAFKDYPDSVVFEVMNEPQGKLTGEKWEVFFADALGQIRKTNPKRIVLMGAGEAIPNDPYLIYTPHFYGPFNFTHQNASFENGAKAWLGTEWLNAKYERAFIEQAADKFAAFGKKHDIPIHIGEFGVIIHADMASRARWTTFTARCFEKRNFSWAYWDFSALFGIYDRKAGKVYPEMADALLRNPMPEPAKSELKILYSSNFSTDTNGWKLNVGGGAEATMVAKDGTLVVNITNPGKNAWNVQLSKWSFSLEQGKLYMVSYVASDTAGRDVTSYMGKGPAPWNHYTHSRISPEVTNPFYCFSMGTHSDPKAGITMDIGGGKPSTFVLSEVKLQEIVITNGRK